VTFTSPVYALCCNGPRHRNSAPRPSRCCTGRELTGSSAEPGGAAALLGIPLFMGFLSQALLWCLRSRNLLLSGSCVCSLRPWIRSRRAARFSPQTGHAIRLAHQPGCTSWVRSSCSRTLLQMRQCGPRRTGWASVPVVNSTMPRLSATHRLQPLILKVAILGPPAGAGKPRFT